MTLSTIDSTTSTKISEVCGLSWSDDLQLLASGGNEGQAKRGG